MVKLTEDTCVGFVYDHPEVAQRAVLKELKAQPENKSKSEKKLNNFAKTVVDDIRDTMGLRFNLAYLTEILNNRDPD